MSLHDPDTSDMATPAAPPVVPHVVPPPVLPPAVDLANTDVLCRRCTFNLRGLAPERNCPECGFPIQRTLLGDPLIFSAPQYLQTLATGLAWILVVTIIQVCVGLAAGIGGGILGALSQGNLDPRAFRTFQIATVVVGVPISIALLYGWWKFSTPDPDILESESSDSGDQPRLIVRLAAVFLIGVTIISSLGAILRSDGAEMRIDLFTIGIGLLTMGASIAQFFASLLYIRWIARRMQDARLVSRSSMYLWLLPVIYIGGFCVLGIGPIVTMILYLLMLNDVRKGINATIAQQTRGEGSLVGA